VSETWSDFITDFMSLTEAAISPRIFRQWAAISLVAGSLERRVWVKTGPRIAYPNLYVLLVAPPGVGKYIIEEVRQLWVDVKEPGTRLRQFHVAPDNMTNASLMDTLAKSKTLRILPKGAAYSYHSLLVAAEEFQVLLPSYDQQFIASLNSIYNNKPLHSESRRTGTVKELEIENPQLNILGGAQPAYFASTFPEEAWATGLARRIIMIYSAETPEFDLFYEPPVPEDARGLLLKKLAHLGGLYGQLQWEEDAAQHIAKWHSAGGPPAPEHSKLVHYVRARTLHALKLASVSAVARTGKLVIGLPDVKRAIAWLLEAEETMPDIFRAMIGRSDTQVIEELHFFLTSMWVKEKQKPQDGGVLRRFLLARVPHEKVETLIGAAERANIIARVGGTQDSWIPKPKHEHGME
jgi:hypothetical protein